MAKERRYRLVTKESWKDFAAKGSFSPISILKHQEHNSHVERPFIRKFIFVVRLVRKWSKVKKLINFLNLPDMHAVADADADIFQKILRPYEVAKQSATRRLNSFMTHETLAHKSLGADNFLKMHSEGVEFSEFPLIEGIEKPFRLVSRICTTHRREGEMTFAIMRRMSVDSVFFGTEEGDVRVFSLAINFGMIDGKLVLKINSVQGCEPDCHDPNKEISLATKCAFGYMPKYLLIDAAFEIAEAIGAEAVLGIKKTSHVYANAHYTEKVGDAVIMDYDKTWQEYGAVSFNKDYWKISPRERKPIEEVASKKRSQYKKRYALADAAFASIKSVFGSAV